jgi:hypothetical protein
MIIYFVESTLLLGLLYGLYKLLLESEKMHRFNRFFLLFALVFGLTAPLISFEVDPQQSVAGIKVQQMGEVVTAPAEAVRGSVESEQPSVPAASSKTDVAPATPAESGWSVSTTDILFGIYGLIAFALLVRFVGGLVEIRNKIKSGIHKTSEHATLVLLDEPVAPQSFFSFIFLDRKKFESGAIESEILDHELTHVRQLHSLDVLVIELLKVIFWFNPFMYLYKRAIQLNHEFLADESVVRTVSSVGDYQKMLVRICSGNKPMQSTSSISYSLTKKRLRMMFRSYSPFRSVSKTALLIPILALLTLTFCSKETEYDVQYPQTTYSNVELHLDGKLDDKLGKPLGTHYTSSGEPFTGTRKIYYSDSDSLHMKQFFEDGIQTEAVMYYDNGDTVRQKHGIYQNVPHLKEIYRNGNLIYKDVPPAEGEDGMGHTRMWHENGQLSVEVSYTGFTPDKEYQGLMTEYDEEGNITKQLRYKDGEVVEKIK